MVNANTLKASEASQALANMGDAIAGKDEMEAKLLNGLSSRSGKTTDVSTNMGATISSKRTNMGATISRKGRTNTPKTPPGTPPKTLLKEQAGKTKKRPVKLATPKKPKELALKFAKKKKEQAAKKQKVLKEQAGKTEKRPAKLATPKKRAAKFAKKKKEQVAKKQKDLAGKRIRKGKKGLTNQQSKASNSRVPNPYIKLHALNGKKTPFEWERPYYPYHGKEGKMWKRLTNMPVNEEKKRYPLSYFVNLDNEGIKKGGNKYTHDCRKRGKDWNTGLCKLLNDDNFKCKTIEVKNGIGKTREVDISSKEKAITFVALGCEKKETCTIDKEQGDLLAIGMNMGDKDGVEVIQEIYSEYRTKLDHTLLMIDLKLWCETEPGQSKAEMYYDVSHINFRNHSSYMNFRKHKRMKTRRRLLQHHKNIC